MSYRIKDWTRFVSFVLMVILLLSASILGIFFTGEKYETTEKVPCYDEHRNKMEGETCIEKKIEHKNEELRTVLEVETIASVVCFFVWVFTDLEREGNKDLIGGVRE